MCLELLPAHLICLEIIQREGKYMWLVSHPVLVGKRKAKPKLKKVTNLICVSFTYGNQIRTNFF